MEEKPHSRFPKIPLRCVVNHSPHSFVAHSFLSKASQVKQNCVTGVPLDAFVSFIFGSKKSFLFYIGTSCDNSGL